MKFGLVLSLALLSGAPLHAGCTHDCALQPIFSESYAEIAAGPHHLVPLDRMLAADGPLRRGSHLAGQRLSQRVVDDHPYAAVQGVPALPLRLAQAPAGADTTTLLFQIPQSVVGLQFAGLTAPLSMPGDLLLTFRGEAGQVVARAAIPLREGAMEHAWRFATPVAAITVESTAPHGTGLSGVLCPLASPVLSRLPDPRLSGGLAERPS